MAVLRRRGPTSREKRLPRSCGAARNSVDETLDPARSIPRPIRQRGARLRPVSAVQTFAVQNFAWPAVPPRLILQSVPEE